MRRFASRITGIAMAAFLTIAAFAVSGCLSAQQTEELRDSLARIEEARQNARGDFEGEETYADDEQGYGGEQVSGPAARQRGRARRGGSCGEKYPGSFLDIGRNECWKCPGSHPRRTIFPVTGPQACERGGHRVKALGPRSPFGLLKTDCDRGWFLDLGRGKCYACPRGYKRTIYAVDSHSACEAPASRTRARFMGMPH